MVESRKQNRKANRQRKQTNQAKRFKIEKAAPDLLKASNSFVAGWSHFLDCIDFGRSNLDARAIRFMNEVPGEIQQAIIKAE